MTLQRRSDLEIRRRDRITPGGCCDPVGPSSGLKLRPGMEIRRRDGERPAVTAVPVGLNRKQVIR